MIDLVELEARARARLPKGRYDYAAGGAGDELTLAANLEGWRQLRLRPRMLRGVDEVSTATTVLGSAVAAPILVAPTAFHGLFHAGAEVATATGVAEAGSLIVLSTVSSMTLEQVAEAAPSSTRWFQLYARSDRGLTKELVERAQMTGCRALVLTVDSARRGRRPRDERNGFLEGNGLGANVDSCVTRPEGGSGPHRALSMEDLDWLVAFTSLPLVVKGLLRADDALECCRRGARAVIVSNHGGRQLDSTVATARALGEVADAVGTEVEVYVDGGLRRGTDVIKALCLGARAVLLGRPVLWGLAIDGAAGVAAVLESLRAELAEAMALCGAAAPGDLGPDLVHPLPDPGGPHL